MAGAGQFEVDPEALSRAAGVFDDAAAGLMGAVQRFAAAAQPHPEAFGLLPQARAAHCWYVEKSHEAHDGLRSVHEAFERSLARGLRASAANYVRADRDSTTR